jgi:hypothetical protein
MVVATYMAQSDLANRPGAEEIVQLLNTLLHTELPDYDRYFNEAQAAYVAAGTFLFGMKQAAPSATIIPQPVRDAWKASAALQRRIPAPENLGTTENLLRWAAEEGRRDHPEIDGFLRAIEPFSKGSGDRGAIERLPWVEPKFGTIRDFPDQAGPRKTPLPKARLVRLNDWIAKRVRSIQRLLAP